MSRKFLFIALALAVIVHVVTGKKGNYVPRCRKNGDYKRAQCQLSKGVCFCVNPKTGERTTEDQKGGAKCSSS
ncbi:hypothetical protein HNY73_019223 [Argiope bruennichi]|uniref:Thyroglobulin type-1 domain-containing protein n=1 Tax=Argiope bruennichi TaxID=94029 RepID=A0A8T0EIZ2_ARGBR|nr:hypothetical protein HNY73_019223 [Argiope bruennichi]